MKGSCCPNSGKRCLPQSLFVDNIECPGSTMAPGSTSGSTDIVGEIKFIANADVTCPSGYTGNWLHNDYFLDRGGSWYGATTCQDSPDVKSFVIANDSNCPANSSKIGWISNTVVQDTQWHGATVCGYTGTKPSEAKNYLVGNNSPCPVGTRQGWISNTAFQPQTTTENEYYGLTICTKP